MTSGKYVFANCRFAHFQRAHTSSWTGASFDHYLSIYQNIGYRLVKWRWTMFKYTNAHHTVVKNGAHL